MNMKTKVNTNKTTKVVSVPNRGLPIMNSDDEIFYNDEDFFSFRPQQGVTYYE